MNNFPCKIIEADFAADIVTLQMEGHYTVSAGQKYLCDIAPVSAEPVAEVVREALESAKNGLIWYRENFPEAESGADDEAEALIEHALACLAAPVAAQPDVTQQTLDDVMAGIPARDAEIEALRMEIEAQHAAQANAKQELAPVSDFDLAILSQQYTLPVDIFISAARQVIELYLAAQAQQSLTDADIDRIAAPWLHPDGQANSPDIRAIVRAIHAQQPVSGADDATERALAELVDKIMPRLDTGDLLADAATASKTLDSAKQDADPLQGAADWLVKDCGVRYIAELARRLSIGYNRAAQLMDVARKEAKP